MDTLVREMLDECDLPGENIRVGLKTAELLFREKVSYRERTTKRDQVTASLVLLADFVGKDKGIGYMCGSDRNAFIR